MSSNSQTHDAKGLLDLGDPHCTESENAVLGSILLAPWRFSEVAAVLVADDFFDEANKAIYSAMCRLHAAGAPPDCTSVVGALKDSGAYNTDFGPDAATILGLYKLWPVAAHLDYYCARVKHKSRLRHGFQKGVALMQAAHNSDQPGPTLPPAAIRRARRHK
jgi:replicative DNA helicase